MFSLTERTNPLPPPGPLSYLQSSRGFLLQLLALAELADLVARLAVPAAAALLAVNPPPARWAHATTFSLLFPGVDGRGQLALRRVLGQAGHVQRAVRQKHSSRRHDEKPRVEGESAPYSIWEVDGTTDGVRDRRTLQVARPRARVSSSASAAAAAARLDGDVTIGLLVQPDGALLLQLQQPPLDVEVSLGGGVLLLENPPQGVDLGVGRLEGLLNGHQGGTESSTL